MKALVTLLAAGFLLSTITAGEPPAAKLKLQAAEVNFLIGLNSDNDGLKTSSAYNLGELQSQKAVIPLLKMLRNDEKECNRIMAALALYKIGDARGMNAIKQRIRFDKCERVRKMCSTLYAQYLLNGKSENV